MQHLRLFFDAAHPDAQALFIEWPDRLAGRSVQCDYLPVQVSGRADGETLLLRTWARAHRGLSPGRWPCTLLIHELQGEATSHVPPLRQHALDDAQVHAALAAARAELHASGHTLQQGVLLQAHTQWWVGTSGVEAWQRTCIPSDKP
jgi:hypothetical protein